MTSQLHTAPPTRVRATGNPLRWSPRTGALITGVSLALMVPLSIFGNFIAINGLVKPGDAAGTAEAITASPVLWVAGAVAMLIVAVLDIIAAAGAVALFRDVNRTFSVVAGLVRVAYAVVFGIAISNLLIAFGSLADPQAALASIETFSTIWRYSLGLFGFYLLMFCYLALRSGFVPKVIGVLVGIAGLGYIADVAGAILVAGFTPTFGLFGFVGEVALIFWLLIRGRRLSDI